MTGEPQGLLSALSQRKYRLKGLRLDELSLVDNPANARAKVAIWKRAADPQPAKDGPSMADLTARYRALEQRVGGLKRTIPSAATPTAAPTNKGATMTVDPYDPKVMAAAIEKGGALAQHYDTDDVMAAIDEIVERYRREAETKESAFARVVRDHPTGKKLFAFRNRVQPAPARENTEDTKKAVAPAPEKPAATVQLEKMAHDHAAQTGQDFYNAYAEVTTTPEGRRLMAEQRQAQRA